MKQAIIALVLVLVATLAFTQDYEYPMYGLYEATINQVEITNDDLEPINSDYFFRIGIDPEQPGYVLVVWDYDNDGLEDEVLERYRFRRSETWIEWMDNGTLFTMWYDVDAQTWWVAMHWSDATHAVELQIIEDWTPVQHNQSG